MTARMTRKRLVSIAMCRDDLEVVREASRYIVKERKRGGVGVVVWDDGGIHRSDVDLALTKLMTVTQAAQLLRIA